MNTSTQKVVKVTKRRVLKGIAIFLSLNGALFVIAMLLPWRRNDTPSLPLGFYRKMPVSIERGALVTFCLPEKTARLAKERDYVGFGFFCPAWTQFLLKPVAAVEGDTVEITPEGVSVNGDLVQNTPVFPLDSQGRAQEHMAFGIYHVPPGYVFVLAPLNERSWDSRYFGPIERKSIVETWNN